MLMARRPFLIYILVVYPISLAIGECPSYSSFYYRGLGSVDTVPDILLDTLLQDFGK
jgi:hypothetical protein